uniref:C-type lectin domain-containing protein n=1 Tax=Chelydra serpentina TaxID=8475 RepID=A0A8C3XIQ2_CHESE
SLTQRPPVPHWDIGTSNGCEGRVPPPEPPAPLTCSTAPPERSDPLLITVPFPPPGGSGCKLCPRHWAPHRDKCYWLSQESKYWSRGRDDCSRRGAHLLVIQDREELEFIQNITRNQNEVWIGLNITSPGRKWTWVDGSSLNQTLFTVSGPAEENSCAAVKTNRIKSESCNTDYKWICQKEACVCLYYHSQILR